jgi:hypothetical protein
VVADGVVAEILSPPITEPQVDLPAITELHEGVPTAGSETEQGAQVGGPSENPNLATVVEGVALSGASANVQLDNSSTVVDGSASGADAPSPSSLGAFSRGCGAVRNSKSCIAACSNYRLQVVCCFRLATQSQI